MCLSTAKENLNEELSIGKMNCARPGSCDHGSAVHGIDSQEDLEYVEGVVNSYSNATMTFKSAADNGDCDETVPIEIIKVPFARNLTSYVESAPRASPNSSTGIHGYEESAPRASPNSSTGICGCTKPDEHLGFEMQADDACLPEKASIIGLRHSSRKRDQVCYYEGSRKLARSVPEKPREGQSVKKKFACLRIRASNFLSNEDEESE